MMKLRLITVCGLIALSAAFPVLGILVCTLVIAAQITLMLLRPVVACLPAQRLRPRSPRTPPRFSVHVATHSEPPDLVIRTLRALLDQDWTVSPYEIILMDNNTADPKLWKPVERFCAYYPERIRFLHQSGVQGAKAGALNIALDHTDPLATHIVTVDADYVVRPNFLSAAAEALSRTGADYVQFPQSYAGTTGAATGIDAELEEYFRNNAAMADEAEAVLLTGTLCVISKSALTAAGGWSGATTTEDAELGVRLCNAGSTGRFVNQIVGQGLLPFSLRDLEKQRYRWCSGNFQTMLRHSGKIFTSTGTLSIQKRLVVVSQLSAWFNLALIPAVLLMVWLATGRDGLSLPVQLAAFSVALSACDLTIRVTARGLRDRLDLPVVLHALACRIALAPQSAKATFDALTGSQLNFVVTDKSGGKGHRAVDLYFPHLALFTASLILLIGTQPTSPMVIGALMVLMLPLPAALVTERSLRVYREAVVPSLKEVTTV